MALELPESRRGGPAGRAQPVEDRGRRKIAREGRSCLTEEENFILQEASRRARDRRSDRL